MRRSDYPSVALHDSLKRLRLIERKRVILHQKIVKAKDVYVQLALIREFKRLGDEHNEALRIFCDLSARQEEIEAMEIRDDDTA